MLQTEVREGMRVRIVASRDWVAAPEILGKLGRVADVDGPTFTVVLDSGAGTYAAYASELEALENADGAVVSVQAPALAIADFRPGAKS